MGHFEVVILEKKNHIGRASYVFYQCFETVLLCVCLFTNRTPLELKQLLSLFFFFFSKFELPNWGCGLSMGAAYTWTFTVVQTSLFVRVFHLHLC